MEIYVKRFIYNNLTAVVGQSFHRGCGNRCAKIEGFSTGRASFSAGFWGPNCGI
jgi:hypothetical protein